MKKEKSILAAITSSGVASSIELGKDFGTGQSDVPDLDEDLESECKPYALERERQIKHQKKEKIEEAQYGEFEEEDLGEGD